MTHDRRRQGAMLIALGLALKAKLGEADQMTLGHACIAVGETFPADDPMHVAMKDFAVRWPAARRDPDALMGIGEQLFQAVIRASWPMPSVRADLEG